MWLWSFVESEDDDDGPSMWMWQFHLLDCPCESCEELELLGKLKEEE